MNTCLKKLELLVKKHRIRCKEQGIIHRKEEVRHMEKKFDLNERLIDFASDCIDVSEALPKTTAGNHITGQLVRSSSSPALHYGEAQAAESSSDFIHKMKVCLKELRETYNCLRLINKKNWYDSNKLENILKENNELISIFYTSIKTAQKNKK